MDDDLTEKPLSLKGGKGRIYMNHQGFSFSGLPPEKKSKKGQPSANVPNMSCQHHWVTKRKMLPYSNDWMHYDNDTAMTYSL